MVGLDALVAKGIAKVSLLSSRYAKVVLVLTLLLTVGLGYGITMISTDVNTADVLPRGNSHTAAAYNLSREFKSTYTQQVTFQLHADESEGYQYWTAGNDLFEFRGTDINDGLSSVLDPLNEGAPFNTQPDPTNITDQVYIYAQAEMIDFIQSRTGFDRQISNSNIFAIVNWTIDGGYGQAEESAFSLPDYTTSDGQGRYNLVDFGTKAAVLDSVDALSSPSWNHSVALFLPAADSPFSSKELGRQIIDARNEYVKAVDNGETVFKIWGSHNPPSLTVDLPVSNAHSSALVEQDLAKLMPIIAAFIIITLYIAFRDTRSIAISFLALTTGVVWTYGLMGYLGIALNTLNMTIVPLIMGVGIDYAIHMINEFIEHRSEGKSMEEAFVEAGRRAGLAMFIATLTTVLGLVIMMLSPSLLMAQLGFLAAVAIASIYVLTITFIPAALTVMGNMNLEGKFKPSQGMANLARGITRGRWVVLLLVIGITGAAYYGSLSLNEEAFGDPGKNFPEDDEIRQQHEKGLAQFYEVEDPTFKTNVLIFEGPDIFTPEATAYYNILEEELAQTDRIEDDTLRTLPFFIETWLKIKGGAQCLGIPLLAEDAEGTPVGSILGPVLDGYNQQPDAPCSSQAAYPATEEALIQEINEMFDSPMRELASLIVNHPTMNIVAMTFAVDAGTYDEAEEAWNNIFGDGGAVQRAQDRMVEEFGALPGMSTNMVGNTATNYLFVAEELPWLNYMGYASAIILFILVLLFTLDLKATIVATALASITSIWWLGILPSLDIGLAITLMLPVVFIFNIGTDYVVHLVWSMKQTGNPREVWLTTGKAIFYSALTTMGAFAVFAFIQNVAVSRTMMATTIAIAIIFVATVMVVPIFYRVQPAGADPYPTARERRMVRKAEKAKARQEKLSAKSQEKPLRAVVKPKE